MNEYQLRIGEVYFCESHGRMMKYLGTQTYQGKVYHNFYEPVMRLFHWLNPQDVSLPNIACSGLAPESAQDDKAGSGASH